MKAGKDVMTDKGCLTTFEQLDEVRKGGGGDGKDLFHMLYRTP